MHSTMIRVYGFHEFPYLLPIFLTTGIFALEFMWRRIISETKNFIKFHIASNIKFPFFIGPFVFNSILCLSQVREKLKDFGFS
jgi:hypothetical protein